MWPIPGHPCLLPGPRLGERLLPLAGLASVLLLLLLGPSCSPSEEKSEPGCAPQQVTVAATRGLSFCGSWLELGRPQAEVESLLGPPERVRDLGRLGEQAVYAGRGITALYSTGGNGQQPVLINLSLSAGFQGATEEGIALGSEAAFLRERLGEPVREPFLGGWRYATRGLAFDLEDDRVVAIHLFAPRG